MPVKSAPWSGPGNTTIPPRLRPRGSERRARRAWADRLAGLWCSAPDGSSSRQDRPSARISARAIVPEFILRNRAPRTKTIRRTTATPMILHRTKPIGNVPTGRRTARPGCRPASRAPGGIHGDRGIATMQDLVVEFEPHVRLGAFAGVFVLVALWELVAPRRPPQVSKAVRWTSNIGIVVLDTVLLRLVFPVAAAGIAAVLGAFGWGLFNCAGVAVLDRGRAGRARARSRDLLAARALSRGARTVATAHGASRRSRLRSDHRGPVFTRSRCCCR